MGLSSEIRSLSRVVFLKAGLKIGVEECLKSVKCYWSEYSISPNHFVVTISRDLVQKGQKYFCVIIFQWNYNAEGMSKLKI